jgi:hypothetical protein
VVAPADQDVGLDADLAQLGDRLLGRLGLELARRRQEGTSVTWMKTTSFGFISRANWRMASRKGRPSMSPVVPPISVMRTSTSLPPA